MQRADPGAPPLPYDVRELLDAPNHVHLSALRANGSPRNQVGHLHVQTFGQTELTE